MKAMQKIIGRLLVGCLLAGCLTPEIKAQTTPDTRRNYAKFMRQSFFVVDTNAAAANNTNLYKICASFSSNTNSTPAFQIAAYGTNAIVIKASHFDYSAETDRDFALLVSDQVNRPIWKSIDFLGNQCHEGRI